MPREQRKHDDGLFFGGALENHGVEVFDSPREFRQPAQRRGDFLQALVQRGGALEIERFAGRFPFALEFRGERCAGRIERFEHAADFGVVFLFGAARETRRQAHFHLRIDAARENSDRGES